MLSMARAADSMLVAFESLTKPTPWIDDTGSSACSRPVKPSTARTIASALDAGDLGDRGRRGDVGQQVASEQPHRRHRHQRRVDAGAAVRDRLAP